MASPPDTPTSKLPWSKAALVLLAVAQFVVVLDASIVNVSLPAIQRGLKLSPTNLSWVTNGYLLTFGGLLLFGGRLADVLGRRLIFLIGLLGFGLLSLACGVSQNAGELIGFRVLQGAMAALVAPAALALILVTFTEPAARNKAFGVYGAVSGAAGAAGVLFGGIITQHAGWRWVFFINVPIAIAVALATPRAVHESRAVDRFSISEIDVPGAILGTSGLALLVYGFIQTDQHAWGSVRTLALLAAAVVILVVFVLVELRQAKPMLDPRLLTLRSSAIGNMVGLAYGAGLLAAGFFFMSLYFQQVLGYSAQTAGLAFLPFAVLSAAAARIGGILLGRLGPRAVTGTGMALLAISMGWLSTCGAHQTYYVLVFPTILGGIGLGLGVVGVNQAATAGVSGRTAGQVSAIVTASQRVGGSLGLAVVASFAFRRVADVERSQHLVIAQALVRGYDLAFRISAGILIVATLLAVFGLKGGVQETNWDGPKTEPAKA